MVCIQGLSSTMLNHLILSKRTKLQRKDNPCEASNVIYSMRACGCGGDVLPPCADSTIPCLHFSLEDSDGLRISDSHRSNTHPMLTATRRECLFSSSESALYLCAREWSYNSVSGKMFTFRNEVKYNFPSLFCQHIRVCCTSS